MKAFAADFKARARQITHDLRHRQLIQTALRKYEAVRDQTKSAYQDWPAARQAAAEIKWEAINHLDKYLTEFVGKLEARGAKVHWASTGQQARDIILGVIREKQARGIIKSKAMTSEEIHLNEALEQAGFEVVESDLGEFIVQLRNEAPYHIVFPAMHLTRGEISELFARELGSAPTQNPEELTMIARRALRQKYIHADVGLTGANFAIAETGMISITENEGNARLTAALPKVMITLLGIEKVLPRLEDLALFRSIPGSVVLYPSDAVSAERVVLEAARHRGICYIRAMRPKTALLYSNNEQFPIGGSKVLRKSGNDSATVIAAGITVHEALKAASKLEAEGIAIRIVDAYSVKPIDAQGILTAAKESGGRIVVVEDHYEQGGLGDAVLEAVGNEAKVLRLAVREIPRSGPPDALIEKYGISSNHIVAAVKRGRDL